MEIYGVRARPNSDGQDRAIVVLLIADAAGEREFRVRPCSLAPVAPQVEVVLLFDTSDKCRICSD